MIVHIHGPEEGRGLACNESLLPDGSLRGACMAEIGQFSVSLPHEPKKTLDEVIREGMTEAADAAHEAVMRELEKNTAGPWNFTGLAGLSRDVMETDAEDHIVRGTD